MAKKSKVVKFSPAGINDDFMVNGIDVYTIVEKEKDVLKSSEKGVEILSTQLAENLSIKAHDTVIVNFKDKKEQIETKKSGKITDIEEYKKSKQKDDDREIG